MTILDKGLQLAQLLNDAEISWGFGGSCLLHYLGLEIMPRDLDVVVAYRDVERARLAIEAAGAELLEEKCSDNEYLTKKFYTFDWNGVEVDFMASPGIRRDGLEFFMDFDTRGPWKIIENEGVSLSLSDPNQWLTYYSLMKGREIRVAMLKTYLGLEIV